MPLSLPFRTSVANACCLTSRNIYFFEATLMWRALFTFSLFWFFVGVFFNTPLMPLTVPLPGASCLSTGSIKVQEASRAVVLLSVAQKKLPLHLQMRASRSNQSTDSSLPLFQLSPPPLIQHHGLRRRPPSRREKTVVIISRDSSRRKIVLFTCIAAGKRCRDTHACRRIHLSPEARDQTASD